MTTYQYCLIATVQTSDLISRISYYFTSIKSFNLKLESVIDKSLNSYKNCSLRLLYSEISIIP